MDDRMRHWHPTQSEVEAIVRELRPLIRCMTRREDLTLAVELSRRCTAGSVG
jgi:hypothetical protein